mmetsp:Transcript_18166/g.57094  ORF Transcript_18166/g.57094 Transcript_18166/m.57094 type:complete len:366 (-) Transcript_18166:6044-7141(-)
MGHAVLEVDERRARGGDEGVVGLGEGVDAHMPAAMVAPLLVRLRDGHAVAPRALGREIELGARREAATRHVHVWVAKARQEVEGNVLRCVAHIEREVVPPALCRRAVLGHSVGKGDGRVLGLAHDDGVARRARVRVHADVEHARQRVRLARPLGVEVAHLELLLGEARGLEDATARVGRGPRVLEGGVQVGIASEGSDGDEHTRKRVRDAKPVKAVVRRILVHADGVLKRRAVLEHHGGRQRAARRPRDDAVLGLPEGVNAHDEHAGRTPVRVALGHAERVRTPTQRSPRVVEQRRPRGAARGHEQVRVAVRGRHRDGHLRRVGRHAHGVVAVDARDGVVVLGAAVDEGDDCVVALRREDAHGGR